MPIDWSDKPKNADSPSGLLNEHQYNGLILIVREEFQQESVKNTYMQ